MFRSYLLLGVLVLSSLLKAGEQNDSLDAVDYTFENNRLTLKGSDGNVVSERSFMSPEMYFFDLDDSGTDELVIIDKTTDVKHPAYNVYVYSADSLIFLIDSINSGLCEPFIEYNDEIGSTVISTGYKSLDSLFGTLEDDSLCLPTNYFQYDGNSLKNVSDELYSTYLSNNEQIVELVEQKLSGQTECLSAKKYGSAIFTAFINYRKAGEFSLGNKFFNLYYPCPDIKSVRNILERY